MTTSTNGPAVRKSDIEVDSEREYTCNLLGTVYENSTRQTLLNILTIQGLDKQHCLVKPRMVWLPKETAEI